MTAAHLLRKPGIFRNPDLPGSRRIWLAACFLLALNLFAQLPSVWIKSLSFEGNKGMTARQLRNLLRRSPEGSAYSPGRLDADVQHVANAYRNEGYLGVKVGPPDVQIQTVGERKVADIRIPISEGSVYRVGKLDVTNAPTLGEEALMQICPLKKGQPYSRIKGSQWQTEIEEAYRSMGYMRFRCTPHEDLNEIESIVDLTLECAEGKPYSVGTIMIVGDESIDQADFKRHLLLSEGGIFNPEMIALSVQYLNQMRRYEPISYSDINIKIDDAKNTVDLEWHLSLPK